MRSLKKRAMSSTSPGRAVSGARLLLHLALGLLVAVVCLVLAPSAAIRAGRAPDHANLAPQAPSPGRAVWTAQVSHPAPAAAGQVSSTGSGTVVVRLSPSALSVAKDQAFTVDIQVVAGSQQVDAAEIHLSFSQTYLQVVDAAGNPVQQIEDLSGWNAPLANQVYTNTEPARILFAAGILGAGTKPSGTFSLARIRFKALSGTGGGSTLLVFGTVPPYQTQIYYGVASVLGGVENGSVTISAPTPSGHSVFLPIVIRQR